MRTADELVSLFFLLTFLSHSHQRPWRLKEIGENGKVRLVLIEKLLWRDQRERLINLIERNQEETKDRNLEHENQESNVFASEADSILIWFSF